VSCSSRRTEPGASGSSTRPFVLAILGPTATGKTPVAVELALAVDGEVISADSRAFFVGLDVVTAKPTAVERRGVAHHLIDVVPARGEYDAMSFRGDVERLVPEIVSRGHLPILAGGGTLYLGAVLHGIFSGPGKDVAFRRSAERETNETLYNRLIEVDPAAARAIHFNDRLRMVRALEVFHLTERPISRWQAEARPLPYRFVSFGLHRDPEEHRHAIAERARGMVEAGLVEEAARLRAEGLSPSDQAARTIGIPEAWDRLDGRIDDRELVDRITAATWALVKRQTAWFRRDPDVEWIDVTGRSSGDVAAEMVTRCRDELEKL
jgi:tRNA dimethylallyltransferase